MKLAFRGAAGCFVLAICLAAVARAQDEQFRERQVLDPDTNEWVDRPAEAATPAGELEQARSLLAQGDVQPAHRMLKRWVEDNPDHERYYEGMFLLGETYFEKRDFYKAFESYQEVAQNTAGDLFFKAIRREMDVARAFLSGQKRIVWRIFRLPAYDDGVEILDRVWEQAPGTRPGEESLKLKADYFYNNGDMDLAQDEYANLAREYPAGRWIRAAMLGSADAANASFPGVKFDDRALSEAQERYQQVQAAFPDYARREGVDARLEAIREQRAEKDLSIAAWYEKTEQAAAAIYYYRLVLKGYSGTLAAEQATSRLRALGVEPSTEETQP